MDVGMKLEDGQLLPLAVQASGAGDALKMSYDS